VAGIVAGVLVLIGIVGYGVVGPDRDTCQVAIGAEMDKVIAKGEVPTAATFDSITVRDRLTWPCRWQRRASMEVIGRDALSARLPEIMMLAFAKVMTEAMTKALEAGESGP
jgi:hypothetical protein